MLCGNRIVGDKALSVSPEKTIKCLKQIHRPMCKLNLRQIQKTKSLLRAMSGVVVWYPS